MATAVAKTTNWVNKQFGLELIGHSSTMQLGDTIVIGLSRTPIVDDTTGNGNVTGISEPDVSKNYERVIVGKYGETSSYCFGEPTYDDETGKIVVTNTKEIKFNSCDEAWGDITHWFLFGTKCIAFGELADASGEAITLTTEVNKMIVFKKGALKIILG